MALNFGSLITARRALFFTSYPAATHACADAVRVRASAGHSLQRPPVPIESPHTDTAIVRAYCAPSSQRFPLPAFLIIATVRGFLLNFGVYYATRAAIRLPFEARPARAEMEATLTHPFPVAVEPRHHIHYVLRYTLRHRDRHHQGPSRCGGGQGEWHRDVCYITRREKHLAACACVAA